MVTETDALLFRIDVRTRREAKIKGERIIAKLFRGEELCRKCSEPKIEEVGACSIKNLGKLFSATAQSVFCCYGECEPIEADTVPKYNWTVKECRKWLTIWTMDTKDVCEKCAKRLVALFDGDGEVLFTYHEREWRETLVGDPELGAAIHKRMTQIRPTWEWNWALEQAGNRSWERPQGENATRTTWIPGSRPEAPDTTGERHHLFCAPRKP